MNRASTRLGFPLHYFYIKRAGAGLHQFDSTILRVTLPARKLLASHTLRLRINSVLKTPLQGFTKLEFWCRSPDSLDRMFWPSTDERVDADSGANACNSLHMGLFGLKPTMPDLNTCAENAQKTDIVSVTTEVTSYFAQKAVIMADNIGKTKSTCRMLGASPFLQEIALWKHHGSVG